MPELITVCTCLFIPIHGNSVPLVVRNMEVADYFRYENIFGELLEVREQ